MDLHPSVATESYAYGVSGGKQVGYAVVGGADHASLWSGTAASWVDLHAHLPAGVYSRSQANGIDVIGGEIWVAGYGYSISANNYRAILWHYVVDDNVPPVVNITSPTSDALYATASPAVALAGSASDNIGVTSVSWSNDRGGSGTCSGATSWSTASVPLAPEDNLITVTARDEAGNTATDTLTVTRLPITVGAARQSQLGSALYLSGIVTANNLGTGYVFMQTPNCAGIMLVTNEALSVGKRVRCTGTLARVDGEYQITGTAFQEIVDATPLQPFYMNTRSVGSDPAETLAYSAGMNTTGLLVQTSGKVTGVVTAQKVFYLDDGAGYQDGYGPVLGLRVHVPSGVSTLWNNKKVAVTGISRVVKFTLSIWGCVNGDWYAPGTVVYVPYIDALSVTFL